MDRFITTTCMRCGLPRQPDRTRRVLHVVGVPRVAYLGGTDACRRCGGRAVKMVETLAAQAERR